MSYGLIEGRPRVALRLEITIYFVSNHLDHHTIQFGLENIFRDFIRLSRSVYPYVI